MTDTRVLSGRYRISGHLARGGMGDVFKAEDISLGRSVAIKILHTQFSADNAFVTRFKREAQAAANLTHPNIVSIYDFGEDGDTYYIVMELISGRTLRDIRKTEGALLPRRAAEIAAEAAAALSVAHQAGVYHRDVKPGNIMLTGDGSVKVTDFGIARALDDSEELTRTGAVIGTATYFSPEQAQGLPADDRSDVYSLGVVLYELVTGQPPFTGESPVAVAYQHVSEYAPPPSELNPDVPAGLEAIINQAMEKDPADRYQSADDMRADLLRFLAGDEPVAVAIAATPAVPAISTATQVISPDAATSLPGTGGDIPQRRDEQRTQTSYIFAIIGLLAALAIGVVLLTQVLQSPDAPATLITVPDLDSLGREEALAGLQEIGLNVRLRNEISSTVPEGFVIATEPPSGTQVEPDSSVTIVLSTGPERFAIPNVLDLEEARARELIEADDFVVGTVEYRFTEDVAEGTVIDQDPSPGTPAEGGTEVNLEISSGPFALTMPDVTNVAQQTAERTLIREGFENVEVMEEFSPDILSGFVISTQPAPGQLVPRGGLVTLLVSKGPEPFDLPNLVGRTVDQARQTVEDLGLILVVLDDPVEVTAASGLEGRVAAQVPTAGTEVLPNDEVRVQLGELLQVAVPDLVGMSEAEASVELDARGLVLEVIGDTEVSEASGLVGLVATQDQAPGSLVDDGSTIRVQIGVAPPPTTTTTTTTTAAPENDPLEP